MTRSNARELAVHLIYSRSFTGEEPMSTIEARLDRDYYAALSQENEIYVERPSRKQLSYIDTVVVGTANRAQELDEIITRHSIGWDVSRISRLTRAILQLALFECQFVEDVPVGVAVNEAVSLAKKYDGDDAGAFVNGILRAFLRCQQLQKPAQTAETPANAETVEPAEVLAVSEQAEQTEPPSEENAQ